VNTEQQRQAKQYFDKIYSEWQKKANGEYSNEFNVIRRRNDYVMGVLSRKESVQNVLDVGCGTGALIVSIAKKHSNVNAFGVDFSEKMIETANELKHSEKCKNAQFEAVDIFSYDFQNEEYDLISCNGFIEYINFDQLHALIRLAKKRLKPEGSFVFSSRNRLMNITSFNEYTEEEINNGNLIHLIKEAIFLCQNKNIADYSGFNVIPFQDHQRIQKNSKVEVAQRFQYTPIQLIKLISDYGFTPIGICPVNIHATSSYFKKEYPEINLKISNSLQEFAESSTYLLPFSSTFSIHCLK
tara:strand:+ start:1882 stop:2775 length:894 start_codon:yes stop_codon:yes gene_type:complete